VEGATLLEQGTFAGHGFCRHVDGDAHRAIPTCGEDPIAPACEQFRCRIAGFGVGHEFQRGHEP
jgi:hypothetical protein